MAMGYSISQWNYGMYRTQLEIEDLAEEIRAGGYGIEWWPRGWGIPPLTDEHIERFAAASQSMRVSLHSENPVRFPYKPQIELAVRIGAEIQVIHAGMLLGPDGDDYAGAADMVRYAGDHGVRLALENSLNDTDVLRRLLEANESLGFCYDVGHGYRSDPQIDHKTFLADVFQERLCHVHLQDVLRPDELHLPGGTGADHFMIGTGIIPQEFWDALGAELQRRDYKGLLVFELRPRNVIQLVTRSRILLEGAWGA